jgi:16S rRNA C967 or C1407 C5-methylase (RsmB/RsmF family)/NOL1/NOP2/fmu family ribosome biogenesis protein
MPDFLRALNDVPPISIRQNKYKNATTNPLFSANYDAVKWFTEGAIYLPSRPSFTLDPLFQAGAYYVQEASSMFIAEALRQTTDSLKTLKILDLCAAPGGKSTLLADIVSPESLVLANEVIKPRYNVLRDNVTKWGLPNIATTQHDPDDFSPLTHFFDVVLVDAPCSGEGMFRKDENAIKEWSPGAVQVCAARQRRILTAATQVLRGGGKLIFSTCTFNDNENMDNVKWLCQTFGFKTIALNLSNDWNITEKKEAQYIGYQFYPHRTRGEGFFITVLEKEQQNNNNENTVSTKSTLKLPKLGRKQTDLLKNWLNDFDKYDFFVKPNQQILAILKLHVPLAAQLAVVLPRIAFGIEVGELKGNDFVPSHDLALSVATPLQSNSFQRISVNKQIALQFLKREPFELEASQGWALICYEGLGLGWVKVLKNRVNNYLPKHFRILMDIPN